MKDIPWSKDSWEQNNKSTDAEWSISALVLERERERASHKTSHWHWLLRNKTFIVGEKRRLLTVYDIILWSIFVKKFRKSTSEFPWLNGKHQPGSERLPRTKKDIDWHWVRWQLPGSIGWRIRHLPTWSTWMRRLLRQTQAFYRHYIKDCWEERTGRRKDRNHLPTLF